MSENAREKALEFDPTRTVILLGSFNAISDEVLNYGIVLANSHSIDSDININSITVHIDDGLGGYIPFNLVAVMTESGARTATATYPDDTPWACVDAWSNLAALQIMQNFFGPALNVASAIYAQHKGVGIHPSKLRD